MEKSTISNEGRILSPEELLKLHNIMLEMMIEFDAFCNKHKIKYVITGGTLLGAVRDKKFIPWDDDADIAMTRREYERFKVLAKDWKSDTLFFQDHDTNKGYIWGYGHLCRPGTVLVREGREHLKNHTCVFIDVFPMDDIPKYVPFQAINYVFCMVMRKILYSKAAIKNRQLPIIIKSIYRLISFIPVDAVYAIIDVLERPAFKERHRLVHPWSRPLWCRSHINEIPLDHRFGMKKEWFLKRKQYELEGKLFWGSADADDILKYCYGDYMKLPPQEQQVPMYRFTTIQF